MRGERLLTLKADKNIRLLATSSASMRTLVQTSSSDFTYNCTFYCGQESAAFVRLQQNVVASITLCASRVTSPHRRWCQLLLAMNADALFQAGFIFYSTSLL